MSEKHGVSERILARVTWTTPRSEDLDARVIAMRDRLHAVGEAEASDTSIGLPVMPSGDDERLAILLVSQDDTSYNWAFYLAEPPDVDDHEELESLAKSAQVAGGMAAVRQFGESGWKAPPSVDYRVHFHLPTTNWKCRTLPTRISEQGDDAAALRIGAEATVTDVGYRFTQGTNGISRIHLALSKDTKAFFVDVVARGLLKFGDVTWLPFANDVRDVVVSELFEPGGDNA